MNAFVKSVVNNLSDQPEKAVLYFPIYVAKGRSKKDVKEYGKKLEDELREIAGDSLLGSVAQMAPIPSALKPKKTKPRSFYNYRKITVQFNPKSLDFRTVGGHNVVRSAGLGGMAENQNQSIDQKTSTTMSCELIFANINISNAFLYEGKSNLNFDTMIGMGVAGVKKLLGYSYSIQPQVDGFLAAVTQAQTRQIIFAWDSVIFRGELTSVNANYKMFNTSGDPIVATIDIEIRQGKSGEGKDDTDNYNEEYWRKKVTKVFKGMEL